MEKETEKLKKGLELKVKINKPEEKMEKRAQ
jgi:hypothetical protein